MGRRIGGREEEVATGIDHHRLRVYVAAEDIDGTVLREDLDVPVQVFDIADDIDIRARPVVRRGIEVADDDVRRRDVGMVRRQVEGRHFAQPGCRRIVIRTKRDKVADGIDRHTVIADLAIVLEGNDEAGNLDGKRRAVDDFDQRIAVRRDVTGPEEEVARYVHVPALGRLVRDVEEVGRKLADAVRVQEVIARLEGFDLGRQRVIDRRIHVVLVAQLFQLVDETQNLFTDVAIELQSVGDVALCRDDQIASVVDRRMRP